jgi:hypothetical protein
MVHTSTFILAVMGLRIAPTLAAPIPREFNQLEAGELFARGQPYAGFVHSSQTQAGSPSGVPPRNPSQNPPQNPSQIMSQNPHPQGLQPSHNPQSSGTAVSSHNSLFGELFGSADIVRSNHPFHTPSSDYVVSSLSLHSGVSGTGSHTRPADSVNNYQAVLPHRPPDSAHRPPDNPHRSLVSSGDDSDSWGQGHAVWSGTPLPGSEHNDYSYFSVEDSGSSTGTPYSSAPSSPNSTGYSVT